MEGLMTDYELVKEQLLAIHTSAVELAALAAALSVTVNKLANERSQGDLWEGWKYYSQSTH
jgi:hypothetical protein